MLRKDEILERTNNGLNVFKHYIPGTWRVGRNFLNPLYEAVSYTHLTLPTILLV